MKDKLTHAGGIGIEESMKVLSQLYGVDASYYVRVNFLGLVNIVDALGGIDVYSPKDFEADSIGADTGFWDHDHYTFKKGVNHVDGYAALAFSRNRNAFADGDNQRGKNQMAVIQGIVDKATSPQIFAKYDELLDAVEDCFVTNMPYEDISSLIRMQLHDMRGWNITTYSVTGSNDSQYCATMGSMKLYVMRPNEQSVNTAHSLIQQVMNGEVPAVPAK